MTIDREAMLEARLEIVAKEARLAAIEEVFREIARLPFAPHPSVAAVEYGRLMALKGRMTGKNSGEVRPC
jgi:hypothetical protein